MADSRTGSPLFRRITSVWIWTTTGVVALLGCLWMAIVFVFTAPFDPGRYTVGRWFRRTAVAAVKINPLWDFRTSGVHIPDPRRPYVVVANHESFADVFLVSHVPWEMKWLSKQEIFKIPVMGWMMRMAGDIQVRRRDPQSRAKALEECRNRLRRKVSVMILPEGTRSPTGELLPFHDGAFRLAVEMRVPIVPMAVAGTRNAMPKGSLLFNRAVAEVRVLEPVETEGLTLADIPALRERVRRRIGRARNQLFRELGMPLPPGAEEIEAGDPDEVAPGPLRRARAPRAPDA